jgi:hypothetical protein
MYTLEDAWLFHLGRGVLATALSLVPPESGISLNLLKEEVEQIDRKWSHEFGRAQAELGAGPPEYQALRAVIPTS